MIVNEGAFVDDNRAVFSFFVYNLRRIFIANRSPKDRFKSRWFESVSERRRDHSGYTTRCCKIFQYTHIF